MQNKKIFIKEVLSEQDKKGLVIKPTKEFTNIVIKELNHLPATQLVPFLLHIAAEYNLPMRGTSNQLIWEGNAFNVARRILENSINYN